MKKYETVVFDLDGTLLNTLEDLADATNYALRTMQMPERTIGEVRAFVGNGVRRLMELSVPGGFDNPKFEETFAVFKKYYGEHCNDKTRAYDGVVPVLRKLKEKGYALAIVSNKIDFAVKELNEIYFEGIVQAAIGEREGVARKPAPDKFFCCRINTALALYCLKQDRACLVRDPFFHAVKVIVVCKFHTRH